ncbi:MAG: EAL domain-containing protein [Longibaculum sp.]
MLGQLERKNQIIQILKEKLEDESFEMYYQPIYDLKTQQFIHLESLMRLNHTPLGSLSPAEFIPIAEETGLIIEITYVIIKKVCQFINELQKLGIKHKLIHINFSAIQFSQPDLSEKVLQIINQYHIPLSSIEIEFTESTLAKSSQVVNEFALEMMRHGIYLGLDDFGTGYSNLTTVINIPFKTVKLDKSLVYAAMESHQSSLAIQHISSAFQELGMNIIAEGIETVEQKDMMEKFQINQIQGYYYAKPMSDKDVEKFLLSYQKNNPI